MTHDTELITPRAGWLVTPEDIKKAQPPLAVVIEQDFFDEDGALLDHRVRIDKKLRYAAPEAVFQTATEASEYIADQITLKLRLLTRTYARKTRSLRTTELKYTADKKHLKALQRTADLRAMGKPENWPQLEAAAAPPTAPSSYEAVKQAALEARKAVAVGSDTRFALKAA